MTLHIDFETRSELDLRKVGLYNYVRHPSTDVWCMSYASGEEEPRLWTPPMDQEGPSPRYYDAIYAHNAPFELAVWNEIMVPRYGWPVLKPEQTWCTMAMCYAMGMPGNLEDAALALGLSILKDTEGRNLMLKMADRNRYPVAKSEDLKRLYAYCQQDVRVERELHKRLLPLSDKERRVWLLDYKINQRGVQIDMESAKAAVKLAETVKGQANEKLSKITGGAVQAVTAVAALKEWLAANGVSSSSLGKQAVVDLLEDDLSDLARDALRLRQEAAKASTAKFEVMVRQAGDDGRLRNMYQFHGAATGRWAGRGVQTSNLVRDMPKAETVEKIMALVRTADYDTIDMIYGAPLSALSRCSRSFFVAPPGKKLISGDWSNVEGRGQAWFAGEDWKLKAFVASDDGSGPGIYELAYSRMFGVPVETVINPSEERQVGKVSELAFGYQGGVGSFHTMSKNYGVKVSNAKAEELKQAWRDAHPKIAGVMTQGRRDDGEIFWYRKGGIWKEIENAALNAVRNTGEKYGCGYPGRQAFFRTVGSFLWCLLPSGRAICFPYPKILEGEYGPQLTYMSKPGQDKKDVVYDPKNVSNWARVSTYGGSLFNNIVQGTCRDFLADCLLALDAKGAAVVLHTYDDLNIEVEDAKVEKALPAMRDIMETLPAWAAGFPLKAKVEVMQRYGK